MKPKAIGIVGGAGPLAGAALFERIIHLCQTIHGCYKDDDFPQIILLSFPFDDMLSETLNPERLKKELKECLDRLRKEGAAVLGIACNTLHAFLEKGGNEDLIRLPQLLETLVFVDYPLLLATSTSIRYKLHKHLSYPDPVSQLKVDAIIEDILRGMEKPLIEKRLNQFLKLQPAKTIVLGCTELSLFKDHLTPSKKTIIDPMDILAQKILERSFNI